MTAIACYLTGLVAWVHSKKLDERGGIQITTENLLWIIVVIGLVGIVSGVLTGYIQGLLTQITGN